MQQIQKLNEELEERVQERTAALEAANRELEAFSYSVAHDLRAPLRGITGFSQLLIDQYAPQLDQEGVGYLNRVRSAATKMSELIDALLSLARVGRAELHPADIDLTQLATLVSEDLAAAVPDRKVNMQIEAGMSAYADPQLLRVVVHNLLENAWKFSGRHPLATIGIGTVAGAEQPTYFVRDNGAGFDPAYSDKLFGAFQRLHSQQEFPGTGIGLAIVQRVVTRHGGIIWAESRPQQGATFFFTLPAPRH
ncbi:MAG TPA: ATP-binding protein [Povalibacter sp.]